MKNSKDSKNSLAGPGSPPQPPASPVGPRVGPRKGLTAGEGGEVVVCSSSSSARAADGTGFMMRGREVTFADIDDVRALWDLNLDQVTTGLR